MKILALILFGVILSACASGEPSMSKLHRNFDLINQTSDSQAKLALLQKQMDLTCPYPSRYGECITTLTALTAMKVHAGQYPAALTYSEQAIATLEKSPRISFETDFAKNCDVRWDIDMNRVIEGLKIAQLPKSFMMVHYSILKNLKDPRAADYLDRAYLCELRSSGLSSPETNGLMSKYQEDSRNLQDKAQQQYVQLFIKEIYRPLKNHEDQYEPNKTYALMKAENYTFYKNALAHAKKIGLPQVYQDYLSELVSENTVQPPLAD